MSEPRYPFVAVDVSAEDADYVSGLLFELGAQGVEERDATTLAKGEGGKTTLVGSFVDHAAAHAAIAELDPSYAPRLEEIVGDAWRDAWKEHFRPFELCPGLWIRPPWQEFTPPAGARVLELEPGRAFGTGLHETTSLVATALETHKAEYVGREILDVGCGSGILALVALLYGATRARAVDNDPDVIDVVVENAGRNGLEGRVEVDTTPLADLQGTYPMVVANIEAHVLIPMAKDLVARTAKGGILVLSGVLATQKEAVLAAYEGLTPIATPGRGEWVALVLRRS